MSLIAATLMFCLRYISENNKADKKVNVKMKLERTSL